MSNGHEHAGSPALLPCPFCGSSASMRHGARYGHWVQCDKCGAGHPLAFDTEADAARAWNRRAMREVLNRVHDYLGELIRDNLVEDAPRASDLADDVYDAIHGSHSTTEQSSAVGNVAVMRRWLKTIRNMSEHNDNDLGNTVVRGLLDQLTRIHTCAREALAAPARNCDRFATAEDAENAFVEFCALASSGKVTNWRCPTTCGHIDPSDWVACCIRWLFAKAEGGAE